MNPKSKPVHYACTHILLYFFALLLIAIACSLGHWQLKRAKQEEIYQSNMLMQANLPIKKLQDLDEEKLFRRVLVTGYWLPEMTIYLDNRPNSKGQAGIEVLTPLCLQDNLQTRSLKKNIPCDKPVLLVKRGWLPRDQYQRNKIKFFDTPTTLISLQGTVLPHLGRIYTFVSEPDPKHERLRQNLTTIEFEHAFNIETYPFVLRQETDVYTNIACTSPANRAFSSTVCPILIDHLSRNWPGLEHKINRHYGYAFQWFALAALIVFLAGYFIRRTCQQKRC